MEALASYLLLGAGTGLLAGLFGVGGGLVIVPALVFIWSWAGDGLAAGDRIHAAVGTSLAAIVITAVSSTLAHHRRRAVLWNAWARLTPGIVVGTALGALVAARIDGETLRVVVAVFILIAAAQTGFGRGPRPRAAGELPGTAAVSTAGGVIGLVSALVGIGGGSLTTPFLLARGVAIRNAIATSAACGLPLAITGAAGYALIDAGHVDWPAAATIGLASVVTAPLGAYLTHTLPVGLLKRLFALLLAIVAIRLLSE